MTKFVLKLWKNEIKKSSVTILDSKTMLQEYSLKHFKKLPQEEKAKFIKMDEKLVYSKFSTSKFPTEQELREIFK